jgi:O-antigen ligase
MAFLTVLFYLLLPFQIALSPVPGVDLASARVLSLGLGVLWLVRSLRRRRLWISDAWQTPLLLTFLFLALFSIVGAENDLWGFRKLLFLLSFLPLFFCIGSLAAEDRQFPFRLSAATVVGAGIAAGIGILQFALQFLFPLPALFRFWTNTLLPLFLGESFAQSVASYPSLLVDIGGRTVFRATAFFPDPHMFSFFMGMGLPLTIGLAWTRPERKRPFLFLASVILLADLLAFSRGGYVGLLAGLSFVALIRLRDWITSRRRSLAAITLLLAAFFLYPANPVRDRLLSSFDLREGSNQGRIAMWREAARAISEHPFLGVGLGNYPLAVKPSAEYREPIYAHNLYLDIAAETGIPNAIVFLLILLTACYTFLKRSRTEGFFLWPAVSLVVFSAHSLVETPLYSVHVLPLFLFLIALSTAPLQKSEGREAGS